MIGKKGKHSLSSWQAECLVAVVFLGLSALASFLALRLFDPKLLRALRLASAPHACGSSVVTEWVCFFLLFASS